MAPDKESTISQDIFYLSFLNYSPQLACVCISEAISHSISDTTQKNKQILVQ
uniref:Uncharacterized protein n=1 Tax=Anguilla anguilla TaxID=7936 RepID=A0A0E9W5G6_ANGAN